jgi:hypothetical protein
LNGFSQIALFAGDGGPPYSCKCPDLRWSGVDARCCAGGIERVTAVASGRPLEEATAEAVENECSFRGVLADLPLGGAKRDDRRVKVVGMTGLAGPVRVTGRSAVTRTAGPR